MKRITLPTAPTIKAIGQTKTARIKKMTSRAPIIPVIGKM